MKPERYRQIGDLFHAALDLPESQRAAFLTQAGGDDQDLLAEVESLLAAHEAGHDFLARPAMQETAEMLPAIEHIGCYRTLSILGGGGMGEVYLAEDPKLGRRVAIKLLPARFTSNSDSVRRFEQEARAASSLNHPNIVTIYEIGSAEEGHFIAMEFVDGQTLRQSIGGSWNPQTFRLWSKQLAQALRVAHAAGIVHRDVKPENLMLRVDGYVKVLDFGLARLVADGALPGFESDRRTHPGMILGTVNYMSPEQARGEPASTASDVFSLGVVFYELVTGKHPFIADSTVGSLHAIMSNDAIPPAQLNPEVPPAVDTLIMRMLRKEARLRPVAEEVEQALDLLELETRHSTPPFQPRKMVGRENELAYLRKSFDGVSTGNGFLVCVAGEPGIGKTTLVEDFLQEILSGEPFCRVARGRCSERLAGSEAYLPWLEVLEDLTHHAGNAPVKRALHNLAPAWYAQLYSSDDSLIQREGFQERMKRELSAFLHEVSRLHRLIVFIDDIHWADPSTIDVIGYLAMRMTGWPILIVLTYRPTDLALAKHPFLQIKPELQRRGCCSELVLDFLTYGDIRRFLELEFPGHRFPTELAAMIHAKTEGSPLFMVDLARYLRDRRVLAQTDGVWILAQSLPWIERDLPESIRGMIERKMAQLSEDDRRLLTAASVQGYEFDSAVIAHVTGADPATLEERFESLFRIHSFVRFVAESEFPAGQMTLRYRFVHVLYQNALYSSLLPTRKAQISASTAEALIKLNGDRSSSIAGQLASLFENARDLEQAGQYYLLAAQHEARIFAHQETITLARRGLELIKKLPGTVEQQRTELDLQLIVGPALLSIKGYASKDAIDAYNRAKELCGQLNDSDRLFTVLLNLALIHELRTEFATARNFAEQCLIYAHTAPDSDRLVLTYDVLGEILWFQGQFSLSMKNYEQCAALYEPQRHHSLAVLYGGYDFGMACKTIAAHDLWYLGFADQALQWNRDGLAIAQAFSHKASLAWAFCHTAFLRCLRREYNEMDAAAQEALVVATDQDLATWEAFAVLFIGRAAAERGCYTESIEQIKEGIAAYRASGLEGECPFFATLLAEAYAKAGMLEEALVSITAALAEVQRHGSRFHEAELHRLHGELLLSVQHQRSAAESEAEAAFRRSIEVAQMQEARSLQLRSTVSLCRLYRHQGRLEMARVMLEPIYHWFTEGFTTPDLQDAALLFKELES